MSKNESFVFATPKNKPDELLRAFRTYTEMYGYTAIKKEKTKKQTIIIDRNAPVTFPPPSELWH
jgi:hypothetical protein